MPHIPAPQNVPGMAGLMQFRPETAGPLCALAEVLLRGPSALSRGERELIGAFVSSRNDCVFCTTSHSAFAALQLEDGELVAKAVCADYRTAPISEKLKSLLAIADKVRIGGDHVTPELVAEARARGATDIEIHDVVLIAAAFCMFNRYVDGLAATTPTDPRVYAERAKMMVRDGYLAHQPAVRPR
ncbi:MAG: putative peroxidase-related enzyme [Labilithrix sp.]|nr:putative peroxidase-related enzyme [Labilithrix sp.]